MSDQEIGELAQQINDMFFHLTNEDRVSVLDSIRSTYCLDCGKRKDGHICHCINDE